MPNSKALAKRVWSPGESSVERSPNHLAVDHEQPGVMPRPHWHAQVEVNYVLRGRIDYRMHDHDVTMRSGDLSLFWGGQPHQVVDTSDDADFIAIHLPLVYFFRARLPDQVRQRLMHGATLVLADNDGAVRSSILRWVDYMKSQDPLQREHAIDELILRIERVNFEAHAMLESSRAPQVVERAANDPAALRNLVTICNFIADKFREDICSEDIAGSARIHPKYAMQSFKRSTGMTLSEYVNLMRLSYAQALLATEDRNVLTVAMDSGFRSLSAFNASFRKIAGTSPSAYRRGVRVRIAP